MLIASSSLCEYIDDFFEEISEERAWQFWLGKDTGTSWGDFKLQVLQQEEISEDEQMRADELYKRLCERGG